jgi:serine/threonine-protein kinase
VLGREVAVKTIDLRRLPDESGALRFEREAQVTAGLNNPGIVTVHDSGVEGDTAYLVMELLPGPSLADRIADGPVPVDEVVEVGRQVASALDAAHARGLVHRDIKPANIAYAGDGRIRVLDFGITQLGDAAGSQALTATHTVMGTAEYLAPEQALGGRVDGRADLYALGCVMYALLAGRPPFRGPTPVATMMMHGSDPVPDVRVLRPETPDWLADVVHGLLAKNPVDRPAGAATVAGALAARESLGGATTTVLPASGAVGAGAAAAAVGAGAAVGAAATQRMDPVMDPVMEPAPDAAPPPAVAPERARGGWATPLLAVVALVALGLIAWQLFGAGNEDDPTATPSTTPSAAQTVETSEPPPTTEEPSQTPTTEEPTPTPDPADAVASSLSAFSDEVGTLEGEQLITQDAAKSLNERVRDIEKALRQDDPEKVADETDKLVEEYTKSVDDGELTVDGDSRLRPLLTDVTNAVDTYTAS